MSSREKKSKRKRSGHDSNDEISSGGIVHRKVSGATFRGDDLVLEKCTGCTVYGDNAYLIGCTNCTVEGDKAVVFRSVRCTTTGVDCRFIKCEAADDSGKAAHMVGSSLRKSSSPSKSDVTVLRGVGSQVFSTTPSVAPDIGALMGLRAIPNEDRVVSTVSTGGRNTLTLRKTASGQTFVNGIEVPEGTSVFSGNMFYKGKQVKREDKELMEEVPAFMLVLDRTLSGERYQEPRQVQIVNSNGVRSLYTASGGIHNFF